MTDITLTATPSPAVSAGAPEPPPPTARATFEVLPLSREVRETLAEIGYLHPTPVQLAVWEPATRGKDAVVQARTGTGKTAAFGLPIVDHLVRRSVNQVQVLGLCPTRELALQVSSEIERLGKRKNIKVCAIYGGAPMQRQIDQIADGAQVIIGTPGRVLDHLRRGTLDPKHVRLLVLDEADEMLSMGFEREVTAILDSLPKERQTLLFSATVPPDIERMAKKLRSPEYITLSGDHVGALEIEHFVYMVGGDKIAALVRVIEVENPEGAVIFCNTKDDTERVAQTLARQGYDADWLNGDLPQNDREKVMSATREGRLRFLVATDVAARGIDISHLTHVINFDFPQDTESYIHRTGRTGRAGRTGTAITLIAPRDVGGLYLLRLTYKIRPVEKQIPTEGELRTRAEADLVTLLAEAFGSRTPHPDDLALAHRLLTHERSEQILAGLLRDHLGARPDAQQQASSARKATRVMPAPAPVMPLIAAAAARAQAPAAAQAPTAAQTAAPIAALPTPIAALPLPTAAETAALQAQTAAVQAQALAAVQALARQPAPASGGAPRFEGRGRDDRAERRPREDRGERRPREDRGEARPAVQEAARPAAPVVAAPVHEVAARPAASPVVAPPVFAAPAPRPAEDAGSRGPRGRERDRGFDGRRPRGDGRREEPAPPVAHGAGTREGTSDPQRVPTRHADFSTWQPAAEEGDDEPILGLGVEREREPRGGDRRRFAEPRLAEPRRAEGHTTTAPRPAPSAAPVEPVVVLGQAEAAPDGDFAEIYVNVGRREGGRAADFQRILMEGAGIDKINVRRIRVRERNAFVSVRREDLAKAIAALTGATIAGKIASAELARERGEGDAPSGDFAPGTGPTAEEGARAPENRQGPADAAEADRAAELALDTTAPGVPPPDATSTPDDDAVPTGRTPGA